MSRVELVGVAMYQEMQWKGLLEDMRGLIADGMDCHEHFVAHHARKRGVDVADAQAALIQIREGL